MKASRNRVEFRRDELRAFASFALDDDETMRPQLAGVTVVPLLGAVFATDGTRILRWRGSRFAGSKYLIPLSLIRRALKWPGDAPIRISVSADHLTVSVAGIHPLRSKRPVVAAWPGYQDLMFRAPKRTSWFAVNPKIMTTALRAAALLSRPDVGDDRPANELPVRVHGGKTDLDPVLVTFPLAEDFSALVMPLKDRRRANTKTARKAVRP